MRLELFEYDDEHGTSQRLAIEPLRHWCEENCQLRGIPIDIQKLDDMFRNGRIDIDHLQTRTIMGHPKPIIVCEDFRGQASEIVDGNHTYAALAVAALRARELGLRSPVEPSAPGFVISYKQMCHFLLPIDV